MELSINTIYLLSIAMFIPVFTLSLMHIFKNLKFTVLNSISENLCLIPLINIELTKELSVVNYQSYNKYQIWKLYNQY